jgi:hypothetical protein
MKSENRIGATRRSTIARGVAVVIGLVLAMHFIAIALWVGPDNVIVDGSSRLLRAYISPIFHQGWRLFAPNPIDGNTTMLVRARLVDPSTGRLLTSAWVDVTRVDWSQGVLHHPAPARSALITSDLHGLLSERHSYLSQDQVGICEKDYAGSGWKKLRKDLETQERANSNAIEGYLRADQAAAAYATQYSYTRWGRNVRAVQFQLKYTPVLPRLRPDEEVRPESTSFGWRPTLTFPGQSQELFAETVRRYG